MKAVFVGGGSHRLLGILRSAMATPGVLDGGAVALYDPARERAELVGRLAMKSPEYARAGCTIDWPESLEAALEGADVVSVILMAGSWETFGAGARVSEDRRFISSDNLSPNGAMLGLKGAPILMNLARAMERHCPEALLLDFANPIAPLSAMVNHHTAIRCLGVCAGFTNHMWDIPRILGEDAFDPSIDVLCAGVNHLSFITEGTVGERGDLFELIDQRIADPDWAPAAMSGRWDPKQATRIQQGIARLVQHYRDLGVLIFSSEGDGMAHLEMDAMRAELAAKVAARAGEPMPEPAPPPRAEGSAGRHRAADEKLRGYLEADLDAAFWADPPMQVFERADEDVFTRLLRGIGGAERARVAASLINRGAIPGLKDRYACEYMVHVEGTRIEPVATVAVPDVVQGVVDSFAAHQTMLGDALATEDATLLARALISYPVDPYSRDLRALYRDLFEINREEIPAAYLAARDLL